MKFKCEVATPKCLGYATKVVRGTHYCQPCKDAVMNDFMDQIEAEAKKAEEVAKEAENGDSQGSDVRQVSVDNEQPNQ